MKFVIFGVSLFLGALSTVLSTVQGADIWANAPYESTSVAMEPVQIATHSYYVQGPPGTPTDNEGFMANAGFVVTNEGVVIFDALGTPALSYLLLPKIRSITDKPIVKVVMSHYHADHLYGLQVFKELGAEVIAPIGAKDYLSSPAAEGRLKQRRETLFPWVDDKTYLVKPDKLVEKTFEFTVGGVNFVVRPLGSTHSNGDQMLYVKQDKALFAGDLVFEGRVPFVAGSNPKHWMENISSLDASELKVIVPGHGPASHEPKSALTFTLDYLHFVHDSMAEAVENLMSFDEAYAAMDWSRYENLPAAQVNRMNAYSVYLGLEAASVGE